AEGLPRPGGSPATLRKVRPAAPPEAEPLEDLGGLHPPHERRRHRADDVDAVLLDRRRDQRERAVAVPVAEVVDHRRVRLLVEPFEAGGPDLHTRHLNEVGGRGRDAAPGREPPPWGPELPGAGPVRAAEA